jgi:ATP-dependent Clp protease adaptor protein ClpS
MTNITLPTKPGTEEDTRVRKLPPYAVVVLNDDYHTFEYVIIAFQKVFGYNQQRCVLLAKEIDEKGRAVVWTGSKEVAELKKEQLQGMGPDIYASRRVDWPLGVELEPMP